MWIAVIEFLTGMAKIFGYDWWVQRKEKEADNVANKVNSLSDADRASELREWTLPD